jgi:polyribonucleotide nucleotidyltransferase
MCVAIEGWAAEVGKAKRTKELVLPPPGLDDRIRQLIGPQVSPGTGKKARGQPASQLPSGVQSSGGRAGSAASAVAPAASGQRIAGSAATHLAPRPRLCTAPPVLQLEAAYCNVQAKQERGELIGSLRAHARELLVASKAPAAAAAATESGTEAAPAAAAGAADGSEAEQRYESPIVSMALKRVESSIMRGVVMEDGVRADGRGVGDVRPIWSRAGVLPRTHGSVLFTRGETQVGAGWGPGSAGRAGRAG